MKKPKQPQAPTRLDLGCGPNKKPGFTGVDSINFPGVDLTMDLTKPWPWKDNSIEEVHSSHFVEHLNALQRVHFVNELYRVLKLGAKATVIAPHWSSCRAYGDPTHQWPPVSEFWFYYLSKPWRAANCPHCDIANWPGGYSCDFNVTWGFAMDPATAMRNQEYQQMAMQYYKDVCQDMIATLTKL